VVCFACASCMRASVYTRTAGRARSKKTKGPVEGTPDSDHCGAGLMLWRKHTEWKKQWLEAGSMLRYLRCSSWCWCQLALPWGCVGMCAATSLLVPWGCVGMCAATSLLVPWGCVPLPHRCFGAVVSILHARRCGCSLQ